MNVPDKQHMPRTNTRRRMLQLRIDITQVCIQSLLLCLRLGFDAGCSTTVAS